ncbi:helix-turn-helix transcriptional regulator [Deinococcus roseus]|uniref:Addiction module antidote protein, HigA family n=1 Tax=Deinococcus roseus TaxID=392414 RepID=A0ABQ2CZ34_9DEIO|nr:hypothetical protein [Deinococcus roseus]GGJ27977.1 hypothetical protein GCM10008938_12550 [Deinococcus roseus]
MNENHHPTDGIPPHPGKYLAMEVESRQGNHQDLAAQLDCSEELVQQILAGEQPITPAIAYRLQQCWGISMTLLLDIQRDYDAYQGMAMFSENQA